MKYRVGDASVELPDNLGGHLDELVRGAIDAVREPVARATKEVFDAAKAEWPERTGRTRAELQMTIETTQQEIRGVIWSDVDYAYKERFGQHKRKRSDNKNRGGQIVGDEPRAGQHIWTTLVRKPLDAKHAQLAKDIAARWRALTGR